MICSGCGAANPTGLKFCEQCGTRLAMTCAKCGGSLGPGARFCGECGTPVATASTDGIAGGGAIQPERPSLSHIASVGPTSERRLVTVLFADLVGFTTLAEGRDAEDTRELLSRYFDLARDVIDRYGGIVEKFIGDAVMAVWGAPTTHEDDAERAVRAGLELVDGVRAAWAIDPGTGRRPDGRGGGHAGCRRPGDGRRRPGEHRQPAPIGGGPWDRPRRGVDRPSRFGRAIVFEAMGDQILKGKTAPVPAWRALRVVAERGGRGRAETLEAPFVGRDDELRLLKDLFHATSREQRARLVSIIGPAGIGKTRLAWEFLKYLDGLVENGPLPRRPLALIRRGDQLLGARRDGPRAVLACSRPTTRRRPGPRLPRRSRNLRRRDEAERRWIEPALLALLGVESGVRSEQLFGAWRTFFERMAAPRRWSWSSRITTSPISGLLDFVDHLLEWSRNVPIYVVTLAAAGAAREAPRLGRGQAQLHLDLPRAAAGAGDAAAPRGPGAGAARARDPGDRRPRRRDPALRGRDGADARSPTAGSPSRTGPTARSATSPRSRSPRR